MYHINEPFLNKERYILPVDTRKKTGDFSNGLHVSAETFVPTPKLNPYAVPFAPSIDFFMHFCPGTMTTHTESINSDLQRGLDRRLRHTQH